MGLAPFAARWMMRLAMSWYAGHDIRAARTDPMPFNKSAAGME